MYLFKLISLIKHYNKFIFLNWVVNIFTALFTLLSVAIIQPALGILFGEKDKVTSPPIYNGLLEIMDYGEKYVLYIVSNVSKKYDFGSSIFYVGMFIVLMFLMKNMFIYLGLIIMERVKNGIVYSLREMVYNKILELPISFFSEKRKGDIMSRMTNNVNEVQASSLEAIQIFLLDPLIIAFHIFALIVISWKLTVFVLILLPISGVIISLVGKKLKAPSKEVAQYQGMIFSSIEETINGLKIIKIFSAEGRIKKYFIKYIAGYRDSMVRLHNRKHLGSPLSEFLGACIMMVILIYGGNLVMIDNSISAQSFLVYLALFFQITQPTKKITNALYDLKKGKASADRVFELLNTKSSIEEIDNAKNINDIKESIYIKNVSFAYEDTDVIKNISVKITKGDTTAFVGTSGSGKSTIVNLITRFYDLTKGSITIDGVDIRELKIKDLRSLYGMVSQDSILFNGTVFENISLGKENATMQEVIQVAKIANAHEFIEKLNNGYDENIGDGGNKLSGGQKQRISIARALLKNPPILILDEATSALDAENEKLVQDAINEIMKNRTSIVIAHRLSTIQKADNIVVIKDGEIVEQGTHTTLINNNGHYKKLVDLQTFE